MNSKQWRGKAAIGRLKGEELAQYNLWLDYLDALELVDTSSAPDIEWPTPPVTQASSQSQEPSKCRRLLLSFCSPSGQIVFLYLYC